ncbi:MAG: ShlB/FhaC/HecB family hemolysin secretion/activation protein [Burkholderiales bacterium]|nr:MAG: ShlB/FhaC/HecB family hemolysin secretion/activation protein [Burkholderiales bacterium]
MNRGLIALSMALAPLVAGAQAAPEAAPRFDILEFEVEGNTTLSAVIIEKAVMPFMGPQRNLDDAEAARAALEKAYQAAGFLTVFVDLPEQRIDGGVVRLKVLEGRIERLYVTGSRYFDQGEIRRRVAELAPGRVPDFNAVQQQLASVNTGEERRVQPILRPGRQPGTVEAELQVKDKLPLSGSLEASNANNANTTAERVNGTIRYDNLWQLGHSIGLNLTTAPSAPSQTTIAVLTYAIPLEGGDSLSAYAVHSNSNVEVLGGTRVAGKGNTLGLRYGINLGATERGNQSLALGVDYRDVQEQIKLGDLSISKPLRYLPLQAAYTANWAVPGRQFSSNLALSAGLRPLLARRIDGCELEDGSLGTDDQFRCKRKGADGGFATLRWDLRHVEVFKHFAVAGRLAGQLASQQLSSAEQFTLGGVDTVRGYLEGAAAGDHGALASLELRSANLAEWLQRHHPGPALDDLGELSLLAFVDAGRLQTINPDPGQNRRQPLLGTGVGVRFASRSGVNVDMLLADARKAVVGAPPPGRRVHARMAVKF